MTPGPVQFIQSKLAKLAGFVHYFLRKNALVRPALAVNCYAAGQDRQDRSPFPGSLLCALLAPQRQQLGVGREDLGHCVLELAPLIDKRPDLIDPFIGNTLHAFLTVNHKRE